MLSSYNVQWYARCSALGVVIMLCFTGVILSQSVTQAPIYPKIGYTHYNCAGYSGINPLPGPQPTCSGLVWFNNAWHIFFKDPDGNGLMHIYGILNDLIAGAPFVAASMYHINNEVVSYAPFAVASPDGSQVHVFFRDGSGNGALHIIGDQSGNFVQAIDYYIKINIDNQPAAAFAQGGPSAGNICVVAHSYNSNGMSFSLIGPDGRVIRSGSFPIGPIAQAAQLFDSPSIIWYGNTFHMYFKQWANNVSSGYGQPIHHMTSSNCVDWTDAGTLPFTTSAGPAPIVYQNSVLMYFRDGASNAVPGQPSQNGLLYISSTDGYTFNANSNWYTQMNIDSNPTVASNGPVVMVSGRDAGGNGIMFYATIP